MTNIKITSWNVNGIRAVFKKGLIEFLETDKPDVFCIQETKAFEDQLPPALHEWLTANGYQWIWHAGTRAGYAGTAIFWKTETLGEVEAISNFDHSVKFHEDGRVTQITFGDYVLLNGYFPNGGTRADGTEMLTYKLGFYDDLISYIDIQQQAGKKVIVVGDYNICHTAIDIARPKANEKTIGFLPIEREKVSTYLQATQTVDVFRHFHPEMLDEYTWWSYRAGARARNVGWRIDYVSVSQEMIDQVTAFAHRQDVMGSDHCPVTVEVDINK